jgi:predicted porin
MKKTLVALAAVSAVSAFAQVSLTGVVDVGYYTAKNDQNSQVNWAGLAQNGVSTTAFFFKGTEDLGGGTKAIFTAELDWSPVISASANQNSTTANFAGTIYTGTPFNGEQFVGLEGNFGSIKLGTPNSPMLDVATAYAQPFGTALGGGFSSSFGRFGTGTASGFNQYVGNEGSVGRIIRSEKAAVYTTPEFAPGLKAQIEYSAQNSQGGWTANDNGIFGVTLRYNQGPLAIAASSTKASAGGTAAAGSDSIAKLAGAQCPTATTCSLTTSAGKMNPTTFASNVLPANASTTWNMLAGNYTMGATTVFTGFSTTKTDGTSDQKVMEDSKSYNIAVKHVIGNVDLLANYLTRKSGLTYDQAFDSAISSTYTPTAKLLGLGANYNLSKNSMLYGRYESIRGLNANATTQTALSNGVAGIGSYGNATQTKTQVGVRVAF